MTWLVYGDKKSLYHNAQIVIDVTSGFCRAVKTMNPDGFPVIYRRSDRISNGSLIGYAPNPSNLMEGPIYSNRKYWYCTVLLPNVTKWPLDPVSSSVPGRQQEGQFVMLSTH